MQSLLSAGVDVAQVFTSSSKAAFSCIRHPLVVTLVSSPNKFFISISEARQVASISTFGGPPDAAASTSVEATIDPSGRVITLLTRCGQLRLVMVLLRS
jgi:hypothetical protein